MKNRSRLIIVIIAAIVVAAVVGFIAYSSGSTGRKLKAQLDLGHKYLTDLKYEEAVATFKEALSIDPNSEEAKEALAQAYIAWSDQLVADGDLERAIEVLEEGYELLKDQRLLDKKNKLVQMKIDAESENDQDTDEGVVLFDTFSAEDQAFMMNILEGERTFLEGFLDGKYTGDVGTAIEATKALIYAYQGTQQYQDICTRNNVGNGDKTCRIDGEDYITYFSYRVSTHFDTLFGENGDGWYVASADNLNGIHSVIVCPYSGGKANGTAYYFNNAHDADTESSMTVLQVADGVTQSFHLVHLSGEETEEYSSPEQLTTPDWWPVYKE